MKMQRPMLLALLIGIGASVPASTQDKPGGYLAAGEFDAVPGLKPAPRPGDPQYEIDRSTFLATRKLEGSPRWALATNDAQKSAADDLRLPVGSCGMGMDLGDDPCRDRARSGAADPRPRQGLWRKPRGLR